MVQSKPVHLLFNVTSKTGVRTFRRGVRAYKSYSELKARLSPVVAQLLARLHQNLQFQTLLIPLTVPPLLSSAAGPKNTRFLTSKNKDSTTRRWWLNHAENTPNNGWDVD